MQGPVWDAGFWSPAWEAEVLMDQLDQDHTSSNQNLTRNFFRSCLKNLSLLNFNCICYLITSTNVSNHTLHGTETGLLKVISDLLMATDSGFTSILIPFLGNWDRHQPYDIEGRVRNKERRPFLCF